MTSHLKCYLELARSGIVNDLKYDNPFITLTTVCNAFRGFILLDGIFHIFLMSDDHRNLKLICHFTLRLGYMSYGFVLLYRAYILREILLFLLVCVSRQENIHQLFYLSTLQKRVFRLFNSYESKKVSGRFPDAHLPRFHQNPFYRTPRDFV